MLPAKDPDSLVSVLQEALPLIARVTWGSADLTDERGIVLHSVDAEGRERPLQTPEINPVAQQAAATGHAVEGPAARQPGGHAWAIPFGPYTLSASNGDRAGHERELLECLELALPLIAKVAGGEAVIFDREGTRLMSVLPNGRRNEAVVGKTFESCRRTMLSGRPDVGPSRSFPGAMAVRIPLTRDFGFGFNNGCSVQIGQQLLEEMNKDRTARYTWDDIVGESKALSDALRVAKMAAGTNSPVWIFAESGSGKELFAQAIHNASSRKSKPFVAVNCAGLPASLIESTLFGYATGAFTGAKKGGQQGLFEQANGGTLLLDEISEMDINLQAKLLRVLQEREVTPVGASRSIPVDVRIITTTNVDLRKMAEEGTFRKDLFYRLNVVDLTVPPLRERKQDIPLLVQHFLSRLSFRIGKLVSRISPSAMGRLQAYSWPGNVREMENCLERAMNMAEGDTIHVRHLPVNVSCPQLRKGRTLREQVRDFEVAMIQESVRECGGNKAQAARQLGISFTTLWRKLHGDEPEPREDSPE
ncbi:MAG: sigma 54-interacting transcriptional regulator [Deltaproteobacteria bacterium]|nr:sigma 54-interacting transcriptional regulator [Deltaproteobacteria bacterium]